MALTSLYVFGSLGGLAHAEHKASPATTEVAVLTSHAPSPAPSLAAGRIALTGSVLATQPASPAATGGVSTIATSAAPARPRKEAFLTAGDITAAVTPHAPEIERCYLDRAGALARSGHLDVTFVIAREGHVLALRAASTGVSTRTAHQIEACIRAAVETVQFPARRNDTTAVVPYLFQRTEAPNAGPQLSCWNPNGC